MAEDPSLPQMVETYRSLAATSINADRPSGKAPATFVYRNR